MQIILTHRAIIICIELSSAIEKSNWMKKMFVLACVLSGMQILHAQNQAVNLEFMDKSVRPQDDFYNYVNGTWMKTVQIPADKARWGSFDELRERTDIAALAILQESLTKSFRKGEDGQKIGDYYKSYVDFDTRNTLGLIPIQGQLTDLEKVQNLSELYDYFIKYGKEGGNPFFGGYVYAHMKNSSMN